MTSQGGSLGWSQHMLCQEDAWQCSAFPDSFLVCSILFYLLSLTSADKAPKSWGFSYSLQQVINSFRMDKEFLCSKKTLKDIS